MQLFNFSLGCVVNLVGMLVLVGREEGVGMYGDPEGNHGAVVVGVENVMARDAAVLVSEMRRMLIGDLDALVDRKVEAAIKRVARERRVEQTSAVWLAVMVIIAAIAVATYAKVAGGMGGVRKAEVKKEAAGAVRYKWVGKVKYMVRENGDYVRAM